MNNKENMKKLMDDFAAENADKPCTIPFGEVVDGMKKYYELMGKTIDLINLIREESELKKHHRAYLHVREELEAIADDAMDHICERLAEHSVPHVSEPEDYPFADAEDGVVVLDAEDYDRMVEDVLTLCELVVMTTEMRCDDLRAIRELGKYIPSFAAFERNRINVYKDARFEADEILARWEDDYEPDEYFSD